MRHLATRLSAVATASMIAAVAAQAHEDSEDYLQKLVAAFAEGAIVGEPSIVDCKLSDGTDTTCFAITVTGEPVDHPSGPWCPTSLSEVGGIWLDHDQTYEVDGPFIESLATLYQDPVWQLYNPETGEIQVTNTLEGCQAAAKPKVDLDYNNYCVQCEISYMQRSSERTYVIPVEPTAAEAPTPVTGDLGAGVAFNGVRIDGPAPRDAILAAHTIAPFDDCGGHVNLGVGYHYHAVTGCSTELTSEVEGHAPVIGIAMDGHLLHARLNADGSEPDDLDECRGHEVEGLGYHYHANETAKNAILPCHTAQVGCSIAGSDTTCDATNPISNGPPRDHGND